MVHYTSAKYVLSMMLPRILHMRSCHAAHLKTVRILNSSAVASRVNEL